jgi:hypothetical protein
MFFAMLELPAITTFALYRRRRPAGIQYLIFSIRHPETGGNDN